jgi:NAD(P)-dependent dehydrogenase (short-subunit alcohol dehydrogenase family)
MGFYISKLTAPDSPTSDLTGKVYVVTGGAAGIGYHTSFNLLSRGATVLIGGRTPDKVKKVIEQLEIDHPEFKGRAKFFEMNFDTLQGAKEGAERVLGLVDRIDGLVNNAGRLAGAGPYELSKDGIEMVCQVKYGTAPRAPERKKPADRVD